MPSISHWRAPLALAALGVVAATFYSHLTAVRRLMSRRLRFIIAARDGDMAAVSEMLSSTSTTDVPFLLAPEEGWQGVTALYAAALKGQSKVARLLLKLGAEPDQPNVMGDVPLAVAAQEGHHAVVGLLTNRGAAINRQGPTTGATALLLACQNGHQECVLVLLKANASADIANNDGNVRPLLPPPRPCCGPASILPRICRGPAADLPRTCRGPAADLPPSRATTHTLDAHPAGRDTGPMRTDALFARAALGSLVGRRRSSSAASTATSNVRACCLSRALRSSSDGGRTMRPAPARRRS